MITKLHIVKKALQEIGQQGAANDPGIPQYQDNLEDLEIMTAAWDADPSIDSAYNSTGFDATLDEPAGISLDDLDAFVSNLAVRIAPKYGMQAAPEIVNRAAATLSHLVKRGATIPKVKYTSRTPKGRGNLNRGFVGLKNSYYQQQPTSSDAIQMRQGEAEYFTADFAAWLNGESLTSVVWKADHVDITDIANDANMTSAKLTFNTVGVLTVDVTATSNTGRIDKQTFEFAVN